MNNLKASLAFFSNQELSVLHKILDSKEGSLDTLIYKFERILLSKVFLVNVFQSNDSYKDILSKIARHNNIAIDINGTEGSCERELYFKLFKKEFDSMTEEDKEAFYANLEKHGLNRTQVTSLTGLATIGAAQASGFGVYMLASSTVGAIASAVGVTLPFAVYTTLSSAISYLIGPIGFVVLGYTAYRSFKDIKSFDEFVDILSNSYKSFKKIVFGDYERATLAFKYIAAMRFVIDLNFENDIEFSNAEMKRFEENKIKFDQQIQQIKNEFQIVNAKIYEVEQKLTALRKEKSIIDYKNKEVQKMMDENDQNKKEREIILNSQIIQFQNFKTTLAK